MLAKKSSAHDFLMSSLMPAHPKYMSWLQDDNADNMALFKKMENRTPSKTEVLEEKLVDQALKFLTKLCGLPSHVLNVEQFDTLIMENVMPLAYMGHKKQRAEALNVLQVAIKNDIGVRIKSLHKELWEKYKITLQNVYSKRMLLMVNSSDSDWRLLWENSITLIDTDLHRGSSLMNSLLEIIEVAFKSTNLNRKLAFLSWKLLIDYFALDQCEIASSHCLKLLCTPLNAINNTNEMIMLTKLEVWWHLIHKVYPSIAECMDNVLIPFLITCFGSFEEEPLLTQKSNCNVSLKTQLFAVDALMQLIVEKENMSKICVSLIQEKLPSPISNAVFEIKYNIFIQYFGKVLLRLSLLPDDAIQNKDIIAAVLWESLIRRIDEYDVMKTSMYKEIASVIVELIKNDFYEIAFIKSFLLEVVLKDLSKILSYIELTNETLVDFINFYLQVDNFPDYSHVHFQSVESLLMHLIKPNNNNIDIRESLEMMKKILQFLANTSRNNSFMYATCELWCILAKIAKLCTENWQMIEEANMMQHNFKTIDNIIKFPFTNLIAQDRSQMITMAAAWVELYKTFDFLAKQLFPVNSNEIFNYTSRIIISALTSEKRCQAFATICIYGLLTSVNINESTNFVADIDTEIRKIGQSMENIHIDAPLVTTVDEIPVCRNTSLLDVKDEMDRKENQAKSNLNDAESDSLDVPYPDSLHWVIQYGNKITIWKLLRLKKSYFTELNENGDTVLHLIFQNENLQEKEIIEFIELFIALGIKPDIENKEKLTLLHFAVAKRSRIIVDLLVKGTAEICIYEKKENSILHFLIEDESTKFLELLKNKISDDQLEEIENKTASFIEFLISKGFNCDRRNMENKSGLRLSIELNLQHIVFTLLKHTSLIPCVAEHGKTLLHLFFEANATFRNNKCNSSNDVIKNNWNSYVSRYATKIVKFLLDKGVSAAAFDYNGQTPLSMAMKEKEETIIIEILMNYLLKNCSQNCALFELIKNCGYWDNSKVEYFLKSYTLW